MITSRKQNILYHISSQIAIVNFPNLRIICTKKC